FSHCRSALPPHFPSLPTRRSSDLSCMPNKLPPTKALLSHRQFEASYSDFSISPNKGHANQTKARNQQSASNPNRTNFNSSAKSRSEEHTSELQSRFDLVCRLLLEK